MDLSLKEAVERIRKEFVLNTEYDKAVAILLEFCQSVLVCKGMPAKIDNPIPAENDERAKWNSWHFLSGKNLAYTEWQAYVAKMLDVERIAKKITQYFILKKGWISKKRYRQILFGEDDSERLASAIVAELKGGEMKCIKCNKDMRLVYVNSKAEKVYHCDDCCEKKIGDGHYCNYVASSGEVTNAKE